MVAPCLKKGGLIGICSPSYIAEYEEYQVIFYFWKIMKDSAG